MKLAVYYLTVSIAFLVLSIASREAADSLTIMFISLLLIPSGYGEWLRVKGRR